MSFENAKSIIDYALVSQMDRVVFTGGEPSLYKELNSLISYAKAKSLKTTLVTNGVVYADRVKAELLKKSGIDFVSISIKGFNENEYLECTGTKGFENFLKAIENFSQLKIDFSLSFVLDDKNIENLPNILKLLKERNCENFFFNFVYNFKTDNSPDEYKEKYFPLKLIEKFEKVYPQICQITNDKFKISTSYPYCFWSKDIIDKMLEKNQISLCCPIYADRKIVFDTDLSIIPCNAMGEIKYSRLEKDFKVEDIVSAVESERSKKIKSKLKTLPSKRCLNCDKNKICFGGCITHYTHWTLDEILEMKKC